MRRLHLPRSIGARVARHGALIGTAAARALIGPLWPGRRVAAPEAAEREVVAALAEEGCPVCRDLVGSDGRYFAEFFAEGHAAPEGLDALERSLGFCLAHGAYLLGSGAGRPELATVHEALARRLRATLASGRGRRSWEAAVGAAGGAPGPCPACRSRERRAEGTGFFLARVLENPATADRYAQTGLLCLPHLRAIAPRVGDATLAHLLRVHEDAIAAATGDDPRRALQLTVGHDRGLGPLPPLGATEIFLAPPNPIETFARALGETAACPICLEVRRAWLDWMTWLNAAARRPGESIDDVLPVCPDHVWAAVHVGRPALLAATAERALAVALTTIRLAREGYAGTPPTPGRAGPLEALVRALGGRQRGGAARATLARGVGCPLCHRLAAARDRSLRLLFALLERPRHRAAFQDGYGLCLQHLARGVALGPAPAVRVLMLDAEAARLGLLQWELAEYLRKAGWQARPEPKGTEQHAPRRAVVRFSGCQSEPAG